MPHLQRLLFTITENLDLTVVNPLGYQQVTHRLRTTLAQRQIVLTRAALIGMPFKTHNHHGVIDQICGMRLYYRQIFSGDRAAIKTEEEETLCRGRESIGRLGHIHIHRCISLLHLILEGHLLTLYRAILGRATRRDRLHLTNFDHLNICRLTGAIPP